MFFVRSKEQNVCPSCEGALRVVGSRRRVCVDGRGEKMVLIIRRMGCTACSRIHHELPDILVPYKRHVRESIELAASGQTNLCIAADDSTLRRWQHWFKEMAGYFLGCLVSIKARQRKHSAEGTSPVPKSALQRIQNYVGDAPGWLARVVRPIVNMNLWKHTRSAFCP